MINAIIKGLNAVANTEIKTLEPPKIDANKLPSALGAKWAKEESNEILGQIGKRKDQMVSEKKERQASRDILNKQEQISNHTVDNAREVAKQQEMGTLSLEQYFALWAGKRGQEEGLMKSGGVTDVGALIHGKQQLGLAPIAKGKEELTSSRYMPIPASPVGKYGSQQLSLKCQSLKYFPLLPPKTTGSARC